MFGFNEAIDLKLKQLGSKDINKAETNWIEMMSVSEQRSLSGVQRWDEKEETCSRYMTVLKAIGEYQECKDTIKITEMANCPTKLEYDALVAITPVTTDVANLKKMKLWKDSKKTCAFYTLGQDSDQGLAMIQKTKLGDYP